MTEESLAWLGCAFWLRDLGYSVREAAVCAGPVLEALTAAESDSPERG